MFRLALETQRDTRDVTDTIQRKWRRAYCSGICSPFRSFQRMEIVGGLVSSPSLDKLVLFRRQFMLGNHMSKMSQLFLEHSSYIK